MNLLETLELYAGGMCKICLMHFAWKPSNRFLSALVSHAELREYMTLLVIIASKISSFLLAPIEVCFQTLQYLENSPHAVPNLRLSSPDILPVLLIVAPS